VNVKEAQVLRSALELKEKINEEYKAVAEEIYSRADSFEDINSQGDFIQQACPDASALERTKQLQARYVTLTSMSKVYIVLYISMD